MSSDSRTGSQHRHGAHNLQNHFNERGDFIRVYAYKVLKTTRKILSGAIVMSVFVCSDAVGGEHCSGGGSIA
jgi:hypothetical protein